MHDSEAEYIRITPPSRLEGEVELPVSKSLYNRALILSAYSGNLIQVRQAADSDDCRRMEAYLRAAGWGIEQEASGVRVSGQPVPGRVVETDLNMAGTALRFLAVLAATLPLESRFTGAPRLGERPFRPLAKALKATGVNIQIPNTGSIFPFTIRGNPNWQPGQIHLDGVDSSQMVSALLLGGCHFHAGTRISVDASIPLSVPYVEMTLGMLSRQGIQWAMEQGSYVLREKHRVEIPIEGEADWSGASYLFAWLALLGGRIQLSGLSLDSLQGDRGQVGYWHQLGLEVRPTGTGLEAWSEGKGRKGFELDFEGMPDLAQTFAVVAALGEESCVLTGLESLRVKETDRVEALKQQLAKLGAEVRGDARRMEIMPGKWPERADIKTYEDHRMAMAFSLAAVRIPGLRIENPGVVEKSFPGYWKVLAGLGFSGV